MKGSQHTYLLLIFGTLFWGVNFHLAQISTQYVSPMSASAARYVFASIGIIILFPFLAKNYLSKETLRKTVNHAIPIIVVGLSGVFVFNYFFFKGLSMTAAINGALLVALNPMLTLLFASVLLSVPIYKRQAQGILISLVGVVIVISKGSLAVLLNLGFNTGDIYLLVASMLFALHNVLIQKYLSWIHPAWLTLLTTVGGCILMILFSLEEWSAPETWQLLDYHFLFAIMAMGLLGTSLSFTFWNMGINKVGANRTAVFLNLIPVFAAVSGLFFGQIITLAQLLGGVFIGWGIYWTIRKK